MLLEIYYLRSFETIHDVKTATHDSSADDQCWWSASDSINRSTV